MNLSQKLWEKNPPKISACHQQENITKYNKKRKKKAGWGSFVRQDTQKPTLGHTTEPGNIQQDKFLITTYEAMRCKENKSEQMWRDCIWKAGKTTNADRKPGENEWRWDLRASQLFPTAVLSYFSSTLTNVDNDNWFHSFSCILSLGPFKGTKINRETQPI